MLRERWGWRVLRCPTKVVTATGCDPRSACQGCEAGAAAQLREVDSGHDESRRGREGGRDSEEEESRQRSRDEQMSSDDSGGASS